MKRLIKNPSDINRLEYWAVTTMFVFSVFFLISGSIDQGSENNRYLFDEAHQQYSYLFNYFLPLLIRYSVFYCSYLLLTFIIVPALILRKLTSVYIIITLFLFYLISVVLAVSDTWLQGYLFSELTEDEVYSKIFQESVMYSLWLLMMFSIYTVIKNVAIYLLENSELIQSKYRVITRDGIYAFIVWMIALFLLLMGNTNSTAVIILSTTTLCGIFFYCYSIYILIPEVVKRDQTFKAYIRKLFPLVVLSIIPVSLFTIVISYNHHQPEIAMATSLFHIGIQMLITAPLSWYLYKQRLIVDYEITGLKTALGRSNADLNFLRSQINPHFLFNILNTLYGTALQEKADRTSEGIQKLGDMMRFMLRENLQEKISLTREIEYLNNYVALQSLRTQSSPDIVISTEIEDHTGVLQIAPMLLIPFVENAFKHGISLKEPSHIRITLGTKGNTLYFDISNSTHEKPSNDPEKDNNGIGLNNVRQRLRLMYTNRHELSIRESGKEFFVHLTIQLD